MDLHCLIFHYGTVMRSKLKFIEIPKLKPFLAVNPLVRDALYHFILKHKTLTVELLPVVHSHLSLSLVFSMFHLAALLQEYKVLLEIRNGLKFPIRYKKALK